MDSVREGYMEMVVMVADGGIYTIGGISRCWYGGENGGRIGIGGW